MPGERRVDMHMHSTVSDGEIEPAALMERCAAAGLSVVALTDHNSTAGVADAVAAAAALGVEVVPACEISTRRGGREHHLLAYFVALDDPVFSERIQRVRHADLERSRRWVENARREGFALSWDQVEARVGPDRVPPFAMLAETLLESAADDPRLEQYRDRGRGTLFRDWFASDRPLATEPPWQPDIEEAIGWVRESGGVPVLAHPGASLRDEDPEDVFASLAAAGLLGVEAWTTWHRPEASQRFDALARAAGLAVTAGADFHGPVVKPFVADVGQVDHNGPEVIEALVRARG